jgi:hypothetical protein
MRRIQKNKKKRKKMNNQNEWEENECNPGAGQENGLDTWGNYTGKWDEVTGEWTWWDKEE